MSAARADPRRSLTPPSAVGSPVQCLFGALHPRLPGWRLDPGFENGGLSNRSERLRFGRGWPESGKPGNHLLRIRPDANPNVRHIDVLAYPRAWWGST